MAPGGVGVMVDDSYFERVEFRYRQKVSPMEDLERDTIQRGISSFEERYGPFDRVLVHDRGELGWELTGEREGTRSVRGVVARPIQVRRMQ